MFERYTETARRVIFFARYEASQFGSAYIESEHLLLGLFREDKALANRFLHSHAAVESIRKEIEGRSDVRAATSTSVDLPLSHISKRVLAYAAEEGERLSQKHIGTEHLLLGLLREEKCLAAEILNGRGLNLSTIREELGRQPHEKSLPVRPKETSLLSEFGRDLTQAAMDSQSHPLVDRDHELERVVQILCRCTNNNPLLIGESDAVRSSIVEALAQRIADGDVPPFLEDKRIVSLDLSLLQAETSGLIQFHERLKVLIQEVSEAKNVLIFIEELFTPITSVFADVWLDAASILTRPLLRGSLQCIAATTPSGYSKVIGKHGSLAKCFQQVPVTPPNEAECMKILVSIKERYEKFHAVTFDDDTIGVLTRHVIGVDNLIWGNDSPHHDSIWPHSQAVIARIFAGVPEEDKATMTCGNVTKLYGLTPLVAAVASRRLFTYAALLGPYCLSRWWPLQLHNIPAG